MADFYTLFVILTHLLCLMLSHLLYSLTETGWFLVQRLFLTGWYPAVCACWWGRLGMGGVWPPLHRAAGGCGGSLVTASCIPLRAAWRSHLTHSVCPWLHGQGTSSSPRCSSRPEPGSLTHHQGSKGSRFSPGQVPLICKLALHMPVYTIIKSPALHFNIISMGCVRGYIY